MCNCCQHTCNKSNDVQYVTSYNLLHALLLAETCDEGSNNIFGGLINGYIWSFNVLCVIVYFCIPSGSVYIRDDYLVFVGDYKNYHYPCTIYLPNNSVCIQTLLL